MKKFINLYLFSYIFLAAGFVSFFKFVRNKNLVLLILFSVLFITFSVLYRISLKKITFEEGYTVLQAISFYAECCKENIDNKIENKENMQNIAAKFDYTKNLSVSELEKMYRTGHKFEKQITNPLIKFYFKKKKEK